MTGPAQNPPAPTTVLAFDFGTRRIGVAVGDTILRAARALATIDAPDNASRFEAIARFVGDWEPTRFVVGLPVHADGTAHDMTARARRFARQLEGRFGLPVALVDERHTSEEAKARLAGGRAGRESRETRDALAAAIILQAYLDEGDHAA